jgi:hypothetical protein
LDERLLSIFERRIFRCAFGPEEENGTWGLELYKLFNESDSIRLINVKRLQ